MRQKNETLLDEVNCLLAKIERAGQKGDWKKRAVNLLLKCHRFVAEYQDDGLGPQEISKRARILYLTSDRNSLKLALSDAAKAIEVFTLPRMQFSESEFYELLA